ncbi:MAG: hypothetical protein GKR89_14805 [Candidatus Latescibacteria bacterium]|nr:hypothetical protein [Candidatus Latescibacterota bacterium]
MLLSADQRRQRYFALNSRFALFDDDQIRALLGDAQAGDTDSSQVVRLGQEKVFVKRIPVTAVEYERQFSTANHYRLPLYFNFGVGSAGLGVWREIVTHIKTTDWVLAGAHEGFPLLYHWRIVRRLETAAAMDEEWLQGFVRYWNGSRRVEQFIRDRTAAQYEAVLLLEYVPQTLFTWLEKNIGQLDWVLGQVPQTLSFLRRQGVIHFDSHYGNILTDGERIYLTDFGLALDETFHLRPRERAFFARHRYYDCGEFLSCLVDLLHIKYRHLSEARKQDMIERWGLTQQIKRQHPRIVLGEHIEAIAASGLLPLDRHYVETVVHYYPAIRLMQDFFSGLGRNNRKNATYSQTALQRRLRQTGFIT